MSKISFSSCDCQIEKGKFDVNNIPLDCRATWNLISSGFTIGVFQLETRLGQDWSKKVQPQNIKELAALTAILRPSALESGMAQLYVDIKSGKKKPSYLHPALESIFKDTHGSMLFQEQILKLATDLAGFSLEDGDMLRIAISKKKPELMAKLKDKFINGCITKNLMTKNIAEEIFGWIEKSQRYSFNLSHAVAYAVLSYQTSYVKTHFPHEFFTSYLTYSSYKADTMDEVYRLVQDARLFGIDILQPDIRECNIKFKMTDDGIRFGLSNIKGVGESAIAKIIKNSENKMSTWQEFLKSIPSLHKNVGIALIKSGACDSYLIPRSQMVKELEMLFGTSIKNKEGETEEIKGLTEKEKEWFFNSLINQNSVRDTLGAMIQKTESSPPKSLGSLNKETVVSIAKNLLGESFVVDKMTKPEIINKLSESGYDSKYFEKPCTTQRLEQIKDKFNQLEKEEEDSNLGNATAEKYFLGISLSCSPSDDADGEGASHNCLDIMKILQGQSFSVCCVIDSVKHTKTKKGKAPGSAMCFLTISDSTYSIDHAVVFPDSYEKLSSLCQEGLVGMVCGHKQNGSIIIDDIRKLI